MPWEYEAPDPESRTCPFPPRWSEMHEGSRWRCPECGTLYVVTRYKYRGVKTLGPVERNWLTRLLIPRPTCWERRDDE